MPILAREKRQISRNFVHINLVASAMVRLSLVFDLNRQPSALSVFPVLGIEGGNHIHTHVTENDYILRKVFGGSYEAAEELLAGQLYIVPVSTLVQLKVTVQHGGLPPDFDYLSYSVNLGLTFGNPGYSEH